MLFDGVASVPGVLGRELFSVMKAGRRLLRHVSGGEGSAVVVLAAATGAAGGAVDHEGADVGGVHSILYFKAYSFLLGQPRVTLADPVLPFGFQPRFPGNSGEFLQATPSH